MPPPPPHPADAAEIETLLARYATGRYRPATFLERGVALPLTTPQLLGARVRPAERRGLELVLPNPAGTEGVYIVPWAGLNDLCAPSLHDRALWERAQALPLLSPGAVRDAARAVAAEGFAGRGAARAAGADADARRDGRTWTEYQLLLLLVRQGERPGAGGPPPERDSPANLQTRVRALLKDRAWQIAPGRALQAVEEMAGAFEACGLGPGRPATAPLQRLCADLEAMAAGLGAWAAGRAAPEERGGADLVLAATELTLRCARRAMAGLHALTGDLSGLLLRWFEDADGVRAAAARPDWILDGWDLTLALWRAAAAEPAGRGTAAAVAEMALLVPAMPSEARDWLGFDVEGEMDRHRRGLRTWCRTVRANQDWTTGLTPAAAPTAARGEALRAAALGAEAA